MEGIRANLIRIKNVMSVADAVIHPGQINQIIGKNNQGKTTLIEVLKLAFEGSTDGTLVRHGEEQAEVVVELSDKTNIRRRLSAEGKQSVEVKQGEYKMSSPQTYLDGLFNSVSFNPVDILDPKKRANAIMTSMPIRLTAEELAGYLGVDVSSLPPLEYEGVHGLKVLEAAHKYYFQRRAEANKDAKDKLKKYEIHKAELPLIPEAANSDRSEFAAKIAKEQKMLNEVKLQIARADAVLENIAKAELKVERYRTEVVKVEQEIVDLERKMELLKQRKSTGEKFLTEAELDIPLMRPDKSALDALAAVHEQVIAQQGQKIAEIDTALEVAKRHELVADMHVEAENAEASAEVFNKQVIALAGDIKKKLMSTVEMPVPGLQYVNGEFLVDDVPISHLSTSKAMRLAIGVARKLAGKLKLICLDGAEALDEQSYEALRQEISGDGYFYIITKVGEAFASPNDKVFRARSGVIAEEKPA